MHYYIDMTRKYYVDPTSYDDNMKCFKNKKYTDIIEIIKSGQSEIDTLKFELLETDNPEFEYIEIAIFKFIQGIKESALDHIMESIKRFIDTGNLNPDLNIFQYFDFKDDEFITHGKHSSKRMLPEIEDYTEKKVKNVVEYNYDGKTSYMKVEFDDEVEECDKKLCINRDNQECEQNVINPGSLNDDSLWDFGKDSRIDVEPDGIQFLFVASGISDDRTWVTYSVCIRDGKYYIDPIETTQNMIICKSKQEVISFLILRLSKIRVRFLSVEIAKDWTHESIMEGYSYENNNS